MAGGASSAIQRVYAGVHAGLAVSERGSQGDREVTMDQFSYRMRPRPDIGVNADEIEAVCDMAGTPIYLPTQLGVLLLV
jgi:hypothetical protein